MSNEAGAGETPQADIAMGEAQDQASIAPVTAAERIASLDFIRGVAVMGILAANIVAFGQPFTAYMYPDAFLTEHGPVSDWLLVLQFVVIDNKMRGLFTLLFGAGLYLFMERTWARGGTRWRQMWRLTVLLLFGAIHFYFIWMGDILMYYAMIGFAVVPMLRWSAKTQFGIALTGYVAGILFYAAFVSFPYLIAETDMGDAVTFTEAREQLAAGKLEDIERSAEATELKMEGDFIGLVEFRLANHAFDPFSNIFFFAFESLPLMLLGVALYRMGFFSGGFERRTLIRWGWIGLALGGLMSLAIALWLKAGGFTYYAMLAGFVAWTPLPQLMMVLGMAALLVAYSPQWTGWLGQRISAAGRAAFTNYLGTSILMIFVFQGWGLGLFGEFARPGLYLVTFLTWCLMLAWSKPWLERYRYGPLEWLWRSMTYGRLFALKR